MKTVEVYGIEWEVTGVAIPYHEAYIAATDRSEPAEGGYVDDFNIFVNGVSVIEILSEEAVSEIERAAMEVL